MPVEAGTVFIDVRPDLSGFQQDIARAVEPAARAASRRFQQVGQRVAAVGRKMTIGLTAPIAAGLGFATDAASDLGEAVNAASVTFERSSGRILSWSKTTARSFGIARTEALTAAAGFGNMLRTSGLATDQAGEMSRRLVELGADMASLHNQDPTEMLDRIRSGLAGEAEPLRRFGVLLSEAAVQQEAVRIGLSKTGKGLTDAQKVQARYSLILRQTTTAHGDFARTSAGVANQNRIVKATTKDAAAGFGRALLPITQKAQGVVIGLANAFGALPSSMQTATLVGLGFLAALGPMIGVVGNVIKVVGLLSRTVQIFGVTTRVALLATGIGALIAFVAAIFIFRRQIVDVLRAIGAFFVATWRAIAGFLRSVWEGIRAAAMAVWNAIRAYFTFVLGVYRAIILGTWNVIRAAVLAVWNAIRAAAQAVWGAIAAIVRTAAGAVRAVIGGLVAVVHGLGRAFAWVRDRIVGAVTLVRDTVARAFSAIVGAIRAAIDWIRDNIGRLLGPLKTVADVVGKIIGGIGKVAGVVGRGAKGVFKAITPFQAGGPFAAGQAMLVGEAGPELAVFGRPGRIVGNRQLALAGAAGGGDTYNITVVNPAPEPASATIPRVLRRERYLRGR